MGCIPIEAEQLVEADLWVLDAQDNIENVSGDHREEVQFELEAFRVAFTELRLILYQETLL